MGEILYGPLPCDVNLRVREAVPILTQLLHAIPSPLHSKIHEIVLQMNKDDRLIFSITEDGNFNSKCYMDWLRPLWS